MSNKKELADVMQLIFAEFKIDHNGTRALRKINMAQINFARRMQFEEVKLIKFTKTFFEKTKGGD